MATTVKIKYVGPVEDVIRNAPNQIPAIFEPTNSYVDTIPYVSGYSTYYGKSIYATNVDGWGKLAGLLPIASAPIKFAYFERAVIGAAQAKIEGTDIPVITVDAADAADTLWWTQMAPNFVGSGFYISVDDQIFGGDPDPDDGGEG